MSVNLDLAQTEWQDLGGKWFIAQVEPDGIWLRTPSDQMLAITQDARLEINAARASWMAKVLNDALRPARFKTL